MTRRVTLRKFESTVLKPTPTGSAGFDEHTHQVLPGATRTEPGGGFDFGENLGIDEKLFGEHTHEIRPGEERTGPGGFDDHTHEVGAVVSANTRRMTREILDGEIFFLSLVDSAANDTEPLLKAKGRERYATVAKLKEGLLYTLVYGPDRVDVHGDLARKQAVQNLAHKFIPNMIGSGIDVMHNCRPVDPKDAHVCESFIIQKNGDDRFQGVKLDGRVIEDTRELEGWWASVIKLSAPALRSPFESGEWTGVSMYGPALVRPVSKKKFDFTTALAQRLGLNPQETDMDEATLAKALADALKPLVDKVETLAKNVEAKPADPAPSTDVIEKGATAIEFEGDPNDLADVEAHEEKIFRDSLNFGKTSDLKKWRDFLKKKAAADAEGSEGESVELIKAKAEAKAANDRVQELAKASNQGTDDVKGTETDVERVVRIRKSAKETATTLLRAQGRIK